MSYWKFFSFPQLLVYPFENLRRKKKSNRGNGEIDWQENGRYVSGRTMRICLPGWLMISLIGKWTWSNGDAQIEFSARGIARSGPAGPPGMPPFFWGRATTRVFCRPKSRKSCRFARSIYRRGSRPSDRPDLLRHLGPPLFVRVGSGFSMGKK